MTTREMNAFLKEPYIAKLATTRSDGWPSVIPLWHIWDGRYCYLVGRRKARWIQDIRGDPRVSVLVDSTNPPITKVLMEGRAELLGTKLGTWYPVAVRMMKKYVGPKPDFTYLKESRDQPRYLVRIRPTKITTWIIDAGPEAEANPGITWHRRYYEEGSLWERRFKEGVGRGRR